MDLWYPPKDRPHLFEWWRPLVLASRAARLEQFPWPIHLDEMILVGRIDRSSRPAIWVYRHPEARGELYVDGSGQAYKFTRTPNAKSYGRFTPCEIRQALWRAGLPDVVQPIWFEQPPPPLDEGWRAGVDDDGGAAAADVNHEDAPSAPRQRGHLTVHDGGRPLAG